ncbi:fimbrial protein [Serratia aquatilis]|uniref:Fimbrial protein n=1 Tax=Serratia aquatilis TaxID=1737515 RepID=A0ABV6ED62_9GAMM
MKRKTTVLLLTGLLIAMPETRATQETSAFTLDGYLILPPVCTLNNNAQIEVPFGNVGVRKVDGVQYKKPIPYTLVCTGDTSKPWTVSLTFTGTVAPFATDNATLLANSPQNGNRLGIKLLRNGVALPLNTAITIDPASPPTLEAVPVKQPGSTLLADPFNATGTLRVTYQ